MTLKQQKFADKYLITGNASASYTAVYKTKNERTAHACASKLLRNATVKKYIDESRKRLTEKAGITQERVMQEISRLAISDIRKLFDRNGRLLDIHKLPDDVAASISGIEIDEIAGIKATSKIKGITKKIKFWSKDKALEMLAKHFGIYNEPLIPPVNFNFNNLSPEDLKTLLSLKQKIGK